MAEALSRVQFEYDSAALTSQTKSALQDVARIMKSHADVRIEVQGHCDDRGTTGYNMGLGSRRASAIGRFLQMQGIETSRVDTVSYGEERPLAQGNYESAWSQNRRAEFRVTAGRAHAVGTTNKK